LKKRLAALFFVAVKKSDKNLRTPENLVYYIQEMRKEKFPQYIRQIRRRKIPFFV